MPLSAGFRLGPYEILAPIGAGGMGEVYRARDSKLGRHVAIKVLPETFARDTDRMARFGREAKLLAALDHTNIASIYGLEDSGSTHALVMQLAEGPTLADRIAQGSIPIDEALPIAKQICEALEYAHEKGIVHRDLKPANIKVAADDTVKILDFGLAKALETGPSMAEIANSPTLSQMATQAGVLLGTAAYMSPEQAKAKPVDRRADIWAFGCVLYEMLTGKRAFGGEAVTETLAAVLKNEPDWTLLPGTPMRVRVLLQRCLQKDPKQRLQAIGDARISLDEVLSGAPELTPAAALPAMRQRLWLAWGVAAVLFVALASLTFVQVGEKPPASLRPVVRFDITEADASTGFIAVLSPDGTRLVMGSVSLRSGAHLWLRRMDSLDARPLEGTDLAVGFPFWSPDSRYVAFGTVDGKLEKIDTEGGPPEVLCGGLAPPVIGGFWTRDGKIVFSIPNHHPGLWEVPGSGGVPSIVPGVSQPSREAILPVPLPDGRHFLYLISNQLQGDVYVGSLGGNDRESPKKLLPGVVPGLGYVPSPDDPDLGYLLFIRQDAQGDEAGTLMAQPFDSRKLEFAGEPVPIAERVSVGDFSASLTGTMVYGSGTAAIGTNQLTLFDRQGKVLGTAGELGNYQSVMLSPDGKRLAATRIDLQANNQNLWMIDLERGISTRFTFGSGTDDEMPMWSPDGSRVIFTSVTGTTAQMFEKLSNGGSDAELLLKSAEPNISLSWSADGRFLLYGVGAVTDATSAIVPLDKNGRAAGKPFTFAEKGTGIDGRFSPGPDGHPRWIAYTSNESGSYEIYVRPFDPSSPNGIPPGGGKWQVSTNGGVSARWNGNGKELFYMARDGTVMSVEVSGTGAAFQSGIPKGLFKPKGLIGQPPTNDYWDVSADGKKFIFAISQSANAAGASAASSKFTVVLNWTSLLKK